MLYGLWSLNVVAAYTELHRAHSKCPHWAAVCCCWILLSWWFCRGHEWPQFVLHPPHPLGFPPGSSLLSVPWITFFACSLSVNGYCTPTNHPLCSFQDRNLRAILSLSLISRFHSVTGICLWDRGSTLRFRASSIISPSDRVQFLILSDLGHVDNLFLMSLRLPLPPPRPSCLWSPQLSALLKHRHRSLPPPGFKPSQFLITCQTECGIQSLTHHSNFFLEPCPVWHASCYSHLPWRIPSARCAWYRLSLWAVRPAGDCVLGVQLSPWCSRHRKCKRKSK